MRSLLFEALEMRMYLFHGSYEQIPNGYLMRGGRDGYHEEWSVLAYYDVLERFRPAEQLPHRSAVFCVSDIDDIDSAGGATEIAHLVAADPETTTRHDMNIANRIAMLLSDGAPEDSPEIRSLASGYWAGDASEDPLWEYLSPEVRIIASCAYDDYDATNILEARRDELAEQEKVSSVFVTPIRDALRLLVSVIDQNTYGPLPDGLDVAFLDAKYGSLGLDRHSSAWSPKRLMLTEKDNLRLMSELVTRIRSEFGSGLPGAVENQMKSAEEIIAERISGLRNQNDAPEI